MDNPRPGDVAVTPKSDTASEPAAMMSGHGQSPSATTSPRGVQQQQQLDSQAASKRKKMPPLQQLFSMKLPSQVVVPALKALETASSSTPSSQQTQKNAAPQKTSGTPETTPSTKPKSVTPTKGPPVLRSVTPTKGPPVLRSVTSKPVDQLSVQIFGRRRKIMNIPKRKRLANFKREDNVPGQQPGLNKSLSADESNDVWDDVVVLDNASDDESGGNNTGLSPGSKKKPGPKGPRLKETPTDKFIFKLSEEHGVQDEMGNKLYQCEICSSLYIKSFSLKRHYLRTHINYRFLTGEYI